MNDKKLLDWTFMVYFSANNDLQDEAFNNLSQMVQVGGTDKVHVLAQMHARDRDIPTRRYFMRGKNDAVPKKAKGAKNPGNVKDLVDFVKWAKQDHEAHNYLIVLWGHTNGIFDDENDIGTAELIAKKQNGHETKLLPEAQNGEDTALTSVELKVAFEEIKDVLGKKVAILGLDSCLMSMLEIAQQVSDSVDLMVASEEVVPNKSWPYDLILQQLTRTQAPSLTAEELARVIVNAYIKCYESEDQPVSLSACRLEKAPNLAVALDTLGVALRELLKNQLKNAVSKARRNTQMFQFRDYVDLFNFCEELKKTLGEERFRTARAQAPSISDKAVNACDGVMKAIGVVKGDKSNFVLHSDNTGKDGLLAHANGVSIYFPPLPTTYAELDLSKYTHWNNFLHDYMNAVFQPNKVKAVFAKHAGAGETAQVELGQPQIYDFDPRQIAVNGFGVENSGIKARLLLPKGTVIDDRLTPFNYTLPDQAFLMMDESAEIRVAENTELIVPRKGTIQVKASTGTSTKASTGTSTKATSSDGQTIRVGWLDVPASTLNLSFSGGESIKLKNGTRIHPPRGKNGESVIVINEVKFKADENMKAIGKTAGR